MVDCKIASTEGNGDIVRQLPISYDGTYAQLPVAEYGSVRDVAAEWISLHATHPPTPPAKTPRMDACG
jgi:hypothetical protein